MQMGTKANVHVELMHIWGNRYPMCPKGVPSSALSPFTPNVYKWALEQMDILGKGAPQVSCTHYPQIFSQVPIFPSAHLKIFGENGYRVRVIPC